MEEYISLEEENALRHDKVYNWETATYGKIYYDEDVHGLRSDDPHKALKDKGIDDSGCSRHITGNKAHLANYQEFKGSFVAFGGSNGRITGKGKIKM
nr:putative ribonuclease H-like domain-containing protein [Tanacetum cinerariifolium]GFA06021.1 putative ribonuclease H-like domain-containing protein [Tanacetum cinerariifolium]